MYRRLAGPPSAVSGTPACAWLWSHIRRSPKRAPRWKRRRRRSVSPVRFHPGCGGVRTLQLPEQRTILADRFGTVGIRASVDVFDGGRKRATLGQRETQLAQAKENLARISDGVELRVQTAYNKIERTRQMVTVSEELLALRSESRRVAAALLVNGGALGSQAKESAAQELEAQAAMLQSQLDYVQAADEMDVAIGRRPR